MVCEFKRWKAKVTRMSSSRIRLRMEKMRVHKRHSSRSKMVISQRRVGKVKVKVRMMMKRGSGKMRRKESMSN